VSGDDLSAVPGLEEAHRRALAGKLRVTSLEGLVDADQRAIYNALGNLRPRPTLARIAGWRADARSRLSDAAVDAPDWHRAASFAVIFAQRQADGGWERRIEAGQTEVDPESSAREWPGWECGPLCDWMLSQVVWPDDGAAAEPQPTAADAVPAPAGRTELRIDGAAITDAEQTLDLVQAGTAIAAAPVELMPPIQLSVTVSRGRPGQQLRAAVLFHRAAEPGWSPVDPVSVPRSGQVQFDLSSVPPGGHDVRLLAWATTRGASLAAVTLPRLTCRPAAG
jgi:hypothetical protein